MTEATRKAMPPLMKLATDLGPLVLFFLVNSRAGIMAATATLMVAITVSLTVSYAYERRLAPMPLVTAVFVLAFGGLTLWLDDDLFIKIKPTIVNLIFAGVLIAGLAMGRPLLKFLLQEAFRLTDEGWRKLTFRWAGWFLFLAVLNEVIWRNFSTDFWVAFKVWGNMPLSIIFMLSQLPFLKKYHDPEPAPEAGADTGHEEPSAPGGGR